MPAAYYASPHHHRRQSSQSQTNLSVSDRADRPEPYPSNRSAAYLPSTAFTQSTSPVSQSRGRAPSTSSNLSRIDTSIPFHLPKSRDCDPAINPESSTNPDDFYRQYSHEQTSPAGATLHQDALRTLNNQTYSQSRVESNGSYSTNWSADDPRDTALPASVPGLRSRKSSVKNLVAQINATSTTDVPPVPTQPVSSSYTVENTSPYLPSSHVSQFGVPRKSTRSTSQAKTASSSRTKARDLQNNHRRPLFGEVLPGTSTETESAGYGIANPRRRAGSENSPMHSPNPMFPPAHGDGHFVLSPSVYTTATPQFEHRRTASDILQNASKSDAITSPRSARRPPVTSRIPVSTRRLSTASDSGNSTLNSMAPSSIDRSQPSSELSANVSKHGNNNNHQSLSVEQHVVAGRITSPGRRGRPTNLNPHQITLQQGAKSPSLRANIIAPPPKISPPLRSSRPRMPVSSASTAASRAKMAEKFNSLQKMNSEKRTAQQRRAKPPELTDIDLDARRLRITQALTRSRESEELKSTLQTGKRWESRSRATSRATSPHPSSAFREDSQTGSVHGTDNSDHPQRHSNLFDVRHDQQYATRSALHVINGERPRYSHEEDSPTLGRDAQPHEKPTMHLRTNLLSVRDDTEPASALTTATVDTEATHIDPEPQEDHDITAPSLLNHVMQMRDKTPARHFEPSLLSHDDHEDRADVESVNLVLRHTAYLDDDEAISKGYRMNFAVPEPLPEEPEERPSTRDSWTSSIHDDADNDDSFDHTEEQHEPLTLPSSAYQEQDDSYRDTMASDAYTMINIVLQEHSSSGIVDQQFADDVYQRVLETYPGIEEDATYDSERIEQLCLQEILRRDEHNQIVYSNDVDHRENLAAKQLDSGVAATTYDKPKHETAESSAADSNLLTLPSTKYQNHRHKSSLDSAEDWASTSPSVGDWMRFAADPVTPPADLRHDIVLTQTNGRSETHYVESPEESEPNAGQSHVSQRTIHLPPLPDDDALGNEEYGIAIIRAPSRSPPPPPKDNIQSIAQVSRNPFPESIDAADARLPRVPHRVASLGQVHTTRKSQSPKPLSTASRAEVTPWEVQTQSAETMSPETRRLKQRKHVVKELVDTEFTYQRDMRVLCDIYKQTALAALSEDDIRVLFGNVEQVQLFARDFLTALKQTVKPSYLADRKKEGPDGMIHPNSSSSTLASTKVDTEISENQRDRETRIGDAFEGSLSDMEVVYTEYIRNRHAANQRLEILQRSPAAQEWLKECRDNSNDITNAWNLDALLVKPVQRITKYPLLLKELIDASAEDHPDLPTLRRVLNSVTDINIRINDVKKHAEMLDQAINRKRGQSDVRNGLSKAFNRRAEKLRQHVGITDMYEDTDYDKVRIDYDNNYVQLMVVANDCASYEKGITQWVNKTVEIAAAAEAWVDVGHSHHQQEESKLRHLAMIVRNIHNIALPDHLEHLHKKVIKPMATAVDILQKFKDDPKGLLHKRDKRLVDYAQMKNRKDRSEKVDKKMAERMDQWEALNTEAKERMRKLLRATTDLVQTCQGHLIQLQMSWMAMIQQKLASVMGINLNHLSIDDILRDWQEDFDFQEATALALGVCNGSLLLQAANMTSFLTPSTTLVGEESPRQMSLTSSNNKRSVSIHSEASNVPTLDFSSRPSGTYTQSSIPESHFDRPYPYPNGRNRAVSTTSGKSATRPEPSARSSNNTKHTSASANFARPSASPIVQQDLFAPPRLSIETHSPLMSSFQQSTMAERPISSNTFFSIDTGPSQTQQQRSRGSGVFSSAMPMSDMSDLLPRDGKAVDTPTGEPQILFTAASVYEFNIDRARREAGFPYLTYVTGEIFDVIGERGELWLAKNQDDPDKQIGWIWNKHFAKLAYT